MATKNLTIPVSLRTARDEIAYSKHKKHGQSVPLHQESAIKDWKYWKLIDNSFPYTVAFQLHHMLVPKRPVTAEELTNSEKAEMASILEELSDEYDCHLVNFPKKQSNRGHYHIHLLQYKELREELEL